MKLVHYSHVAVENLYSIDNNKESFMVRSGYKPAGLWVTPYGTEDNWKAWCEVENFHLEGLKYAHEVMLRDDAAIRWVRNDDELLVFHNEYTRRNLYQDNAIDWGKVARDYQGIMIIPYLWNHRLGGPCSKWYYTWDCASGCIWDANAIDNFRLMGEDNESIERTTEASGEENV